MPMISIEFTEKWINKTKNVFMFGKVITELSKDELLACLAFLIHKQVEDRKRG